MFPHFFEYIMQSFHLLNFFINFALLLRGILQNNLLNSVQFIDISLKKIKKIIQRVQLHEQLQQPQ
jgi:hypothetical protein